MTTTVHHSQNSTPDSRFIPVSVDETTISETARADYMATIRVVLVLAADEREITAGLLRDWTPSSKDKILRSFWYADDFV